MIDINTLDKVVTIHKKIDDLESLFCRVGIGNLMKDREGLELLKEYTTIKLEYMDLIKEAESLSKGA